jgi:hypothetical protein
VWKRTFAGRVLTFHLAGINNQNFLMRDDESGSYWQQISGRAISGPLTGSQLEPVRSDELTFSLWRSEWPAGKVLKPVAKFARDYEDKDWEVQMLKARTVLAFPKSGIKARELMWGIAAFGASRAFAINRILKEKLIEDRVGTEPVLIVVGPDNKSIRAFRSRLKPGEAAPDFYRDAALARTAEQDVLASAIMTDSATGSRWNFRGCAVSGKLAGHCLEEVPGLKDYWFDWRNYHPHTSVFGM